MPHSVQLSDQSTPLEDIISSPEFLLIFTAYKEYCCSLKADKQQPMAVFWLSYIVTVSLLLCFIRVTREGNWKLHVTSVSEMLPWFFAYDRPNYAQYVSVYLSQMQSLPSTNPAAHEALLSGNFCVQRSKSSFAQVAVDQAIGQTINSDTKITGGIVGFSQNPGAVQRWVLTAHERAAMTVACWNLAQSKPKTKTW